MRIFKFLAVSVILVVVGIAVSMAYITQILDPNDLKPTVVNAAKKEQVDLQLNGNISWNFWPWLSISVEKVSASSPKWEFEADRLEISLGILSLLSDAIVIDQLIAIAPQVRFKPQLRTIKSPHAEIDQLSFSPIIIRRLKISDGKIVELFPELTLSRIQVSIDSLTPAASADLELSSYVNFRKYQAPLGIIAEITPTNAFDGLTVKNAEISSRNLNLSFQGYLSTTLAGQYSGEGKLTSDEFSPRKWLRAGDFPVPNTSDLTRFNKLTLETGIKLSNEMISLRPFTLMVDETSVDGKIDVLLAPFNVNLELLADHLNLDPYFADHKNEKSKERLEYFWPPGTYKLDIARLTFLGTQFAPLGADLGISSDEITLGRLDAGILDGEIRASGTHLIAPQITNLSGTLSEVQLAKLALAKPFHNLTGQAQASFDLRGAGQNVEELLGSLTGPVRLKVKDAFLEPLNISQSLCQDMGAEIKVQPNSFDTLRIDADFQEGIAAIKRFESRIGNSIIRGSGRISLLSSAANIQGSFQIPSDGQLGYCRATDGLHGKKLPLVCRGQVRNQTLECLVDSKVLQDLASKNK